MLHVGDDLSRLLDGLDGLVSVHTDAVKEQLNGKLGKVKEDLVCCYWKE